MSSLSRENAQSVHINLLISVFLAVPSQENPGWFYPNLFYQDVTWVIEKLEIIILKAPELFSKVISIGKPTE